MYISWLASVLEYHSLRDIDTDMLNNFVIVACLAVATSYLNVLARPASLASGASMIGMCFYMALFPPPDASTFRARWRRGYQCARQLPRLQCLSNGYSPIRHSCCAGLSGQVLGVRTLPRHHFMSHPGSLQILQEAWSESARGEHGSQAIYDVVRGIHPCAIYDGVQSIPGDQLLPARPVDVPVCR